MVRIISLLPWGVRDFVFVSFLPFSFFHTVFCLFHNEFLKAVLVPQYFMVFSTLRIKIILKNSKLKNNKLKITHPAKEHFFNVNGLTGEFLFPEIDLFIPRASPTFENMKIAFVITRF